MKIIHTSDWHLGQVFNNFEREEEHEAFLGHLCSIVKAHKPDALLICGDTFHSGAPGAAVRKLYTDSLLSLHNSAPSMQIVLIAGNHDSPSYLEADGKLWNLAGVHIFGKCSPNPADQVLPIEVDGKCVGVVAALPFSYPQNIPVIGEDTSLTTRAATYAAAAIREAEKISNGTLPTIVMAHTTIRESDIAEKKDDVGGIRTQSLIDFSGSFDYLALGHIHKSQTLKGPSKSIARYPGSPIPISFSEEEYNHSVSLVEIGKRGEEPKVTEIPIPVSVPMFTYPKEFLPLEEVLPLLRDLPKDKTAYLRVRLKYDDKTSSLAYEKIRDAVSEKAYRFCMLKSDDKTTRSGEGAVKMGISQMRERDPLDIADLFYKSKYSTDMGEDLKSLLKEVKEDVTKQE